MKINLKSCILALMATALSQLYVNAQNFEYSTIELDYVHFGGDTILIRIDGANSLYNGYHWSNSTSATHKPAAYVSNKAPKVTAHFKWTCETNPDSVYVRGLAPEGMEFPSVKVPILTAGATQTFDYPLTAASTVFEANKARYFEEFGIEWQISFDGTEWMKVGQSTTEIFVLKSNPMPETSDFKYWHSVYYLSCKNADGLSTETEMIPAIFSEFEDQQVLNHKGDTLHYYKNMATGNTSLQTLLLHRDAQCYTFAKLFIALLKIQGIVRTNNYVNITPMGNLVCGGNSVNRFIVKNWAPTGAMTSSCSSFPYLNIYSGSLFNSSYTAYNFSYTEIADEDGLPGPGNSNPSSYFNNHQIALIDGKYYDACYGVAYNTLAEYTTNSIQGWSYRVSAGGSTYNCYFTTDLSLSSFTQSISTF